ncbi:aldo/keto reductase [Latilactobacillus graminis]|uniref:Aldo keto reductase family protein n=2 Tax=Latilactobacillus graminis TaxID=60519 RepID=A0AA89IA47_9LACO|nr:aldo/keto reductase [Latilactobacillus graminis]KRM24525.1 aldo keto reductase family protein [Latilactobacillus graminis DSM 20719]QFP79021.1 aldo/keto reductase [Latilactobacillus graminis]
MQKINIGGSGLMASPIVWGVMRIPQLNDQEALTMLKTAYEDGINFFDNADIYGDGASEIKFGKALKASHIDRDQVLVQTKVGIGKNMYDFSKAHIIEGVEASLSRLQLDHVDTLLLHRPDPLMEPDAIAEAFLQLQNSGKVRQFGVSNFNPMQVDLLQQAVPQALIANQLQFGLMHTGMLDAGMHTNMNDTRSIQHDGGLLEYSRLSNMTIQAWSPYQYGFFAGVFIDNPKFPELNATLKKVAQAHDTNVNAIASAWLLRIPASIQVVVGTMNPARLTEICAAARITLTRKEWYDLYLAAGNDLP